MKGKFVKDERRAYTGMFELDEKYTILKVYNGSKYCDVIDMNGSVKEGVFFNRFEPIYEVGDLVKVIKDIDGDGVSRKDIGKTFLVSRVYGSSYKYPYMLKDSDYGRNIQELEIVKTKSQLEEKEETNKQTNTYKNEINTYRKLDEAFKKDELLRVTDGLYKDFQGEFIDYARSMEMVVIRVDEFNVANIPVNLVERVKKPINNTHITETKIEYIDGIRVQVKYSGKKTVVTIMGMGFSGVALCDPETDFDEKFGRELAYLRAVAKLHDATKTRVENELNAVQAKSKVVAEKIAELIK